MPPLIETKEELASLIRVAVNTADGFGEWAAAAHLNQALIDLTGSGIAPSFDD